MIRNYGVKLFCFNNAFYATKIDQIAVDFRKWIKLCFSGLICTNVKMRCSVQFVQAPSKSWDLCIGSQKEADWR